MQEKKQINIIIIGTKDFNNYKLFEEKLYEKLEKYFEEDYKIILRTQNNNILSFVDKFVEENNCELEIYPIQYQELGNKAIFENIKKLIWGEGIKDCADFLLTFKNKWDGEKDLYMLNKVIEEFKSIIDLKIFNSKKYFLFTD